MLIPFNAPKDTPCQILIDEGQSLGGQDAEVESFAPCDQYTLQGDAFARAIFDNTELPVPLEDSIANMAVIEAIFRSGDSGHWEPVEQ